MKEHEVAYFRCGVVEISWLPKQEEEEERTAGFVPRADRAQAKAEAQLVEKGEVSSRQELYERVYKGKLPTLRNHEVNE